MKITACILALFILIFISRIAYKMDMADVVKRESTLVAQYAMPLGSAKKRNTPRQEVIAAIKSIKVMFNVRMLLPCHNARVIGASLRAS